MSPRPLLPAFLLALAACGDAAGPVTVPLALAVRPARGEVTSRDTVTVRVVARNVSDAPVSFMSGGCALDFDVTDATGTRTSTGTPLRYCTMNLVGRTVAPGDSIVETTVWQASLVVGGDALVPAAPGTYTLRPRLIGTRDGDRGIVALQRTTAPIVVR